MVTSYTPTPVSVASGGSTTFDGSSSSTNEAVVTSVVGAFDAEIYYEAYDGTAWQEISPIPDSSGNVTYGSPFHSQGNRVLIVSGERRIRIDNVDTASGYIALDGDEV